MNGQPKDVSRFLSYILNDFSQFDRPLFPSNDIKGIDICNGKQQASNGLNVERLRCRRSLNGAQLTHRPKHITKREEKRMTTTIKAFHLFKIFYGETQDDEIDSQINLVSLYRRCIWR